MYDISISVQLLLSYWLLTMADFVPKKEHLRHAMLHYFVMKKTAAETVRILVAVYGEHAPSFPTCKRWFTRFRRGDFDVSDKERPGQPKKFEDRELEALLEEDPCQTQGQLAESLGVGRRTIGDRLKAIGKILKEGKWVPHDLNDRQIEKRKVISELLLYRQERKGFVHRIITGDEKWIYFDNPKRNKAYLDPGQSSPSTPRQNRFGKKTMLCVWWDQKGILFYELLKPGETVNASRYRQQMINVNLALIDNRPEWDGRHGRKILLHDNASSHTAKLVKDTLKRFEWEILPHPPYSPDLAPSDYHLFRSMAHGLAEQHFANFEEVENWLQIWFASNSEKFFWTGIHNLPKRWRKCVDADGQYFE